MFEYCRLSKLVLHTFGAVKAARVSDHRGNGLGASLFDFLHSLSIATAVSAISVQAISNNSAVNGTVHSKALCLQIPRSPLAILATPLEISVLALFSSSTCPNSLRPSPHDF